MLSPGVTLIKPYYQDKWVTIYHGDCREILPSLPKSDLVFTDPVYEEIEQYELVAKIASVLLVWSGVRCLPTNLDTIRKYLTYRGLFAYINQTTGHLIGKMINKTHFLIWADKTRQSKMFGYLPNGYLSTSWGRDKNYHKWAKNPRFIELAIVAFTSANDLILDPFLGNGLTAYSAKKLNRKCIGIEIEERYCEIATNRCRQAVMDLKL